MKIITNFFQKSAWNIFDAYPCSITAKFQKRVMNGFRETASRMDERMDVIPEASNDFVERPKINGFWDISVRTDGQGLNSRFLQINILQTNYIYFTYCFGKFQVILSIFFTKDGLKHQSNNKQTINEKVLPIYKIPQRKSSFYQRLFVSTKLFQIIEEIFTQTFRNVPSM